MKLAKALRRRCRIAAVAAGLPIFVCIFYPSPPVYAQSIGVTGCQFVAPDCSTIVSSVQNPSMSITAMNGDVSAKCVGTLSPTDSAASEGTTKQTKIIKCNFSNAQLPCTVGASSLQNLNSSQNGSCQTTCSVTVQQNTVSIQQENSVVLDQDNGSNSTGNDNSAIQLQIGAIQTNDWQEIIRPNGRVSLTCEVNGAN